MDTRQQMSDLDYLPNLKELLLRREVILPNVMKRVLTITTLEKLTLFGMYSTDKICFKVSKVKVSIFFFSQSIGDINLLFRHL